MTIDGIVSRPLLGFVHIERFSVQEGPNKTVEPMLL
jgi:hypothetical protein